VLESFSPVEKFSTKSQPDQKQGVKQTKRVIALFLIVTLLAACIFVTAVDAAPIGTDPKTVVKYAKSWVGVKNVHGGNSRAGIDCSHLVLQVYKAAGAKSYYFMKVPAMRNNKNFKIIATPAFGDVVLFKKDVTYKGKTYGLTSHVGIYIGGNKMVDTSFTSGKVVITNFKTSPFKDGSPYYARWTKK